MTDDLRPDLELIASLIPASSRVLDVGCGDGALLAYLARNRQVDGRGMELAQDGVNRAVARGLFVVQGDADRDLADYPDNSFDYVILSRTLQAVQRPRDVLLHLLRIGRRAIVTIPNFAHWKVRLALLATGRMPVTGALSQSWFETDNIHFCTILDLLDLAAADNIRVVDFRPYRADGRPLSVGPKTANLLAEQALFTLEKR
ncbi:methionine biosynthesis protein MetW [Yunchengibacter salinarum]|uniref:methionine biosynthesis protein MetW n=1 Tax=Yunchengibacter salinarum TaxID=3133399 RepID=UPI0035B691D4